MIKVNAGSNQTNMGFGGSGAAARKLISRYEQGTHAVQTAAPVSERVSTRPLAKLIDLPAFKKAQQALEEAKIALKEKQEALKRKADFQRRKDLRKERDLARLQRAMDDAKRHPRIQTDPETRKAQADANIAAMMAEVQRQPRTKIDPEVKRAQADANIATMMADAKRYPKTPQSVIAQQNSEAYQRALASAQNSPRLPFLDKKA